jgi:glycosyltransferase involved in cell wall biosynthesis
MRWATGSPARVIFFEDSFLADAAAVAAEYDLLIAGSSWGEAVLRARGVRNVATVFQGVDPSLFHPAPRAGTLDGRFAVFSGGKLERRKGQDLVVLAFRAFAERHKNAVLVTSWHSPWPIAALTVNQNVSIRTPRGDAGADRTDCRRGILPGRIGTGDGAARAVPRRCDDAG